MSDRGLSERDLWHLDSHAYEVEQGPGFTSPEDSHGTIAVCRHCKEEFGTVSAERLHDCEGDRWSPPDQTPFIEPAVHELGAHLLWEGPEDNGLRPYFAIVSNFDRVLGRQLRFDIDGEEWEINHDENKVKYWTGKIAARERDSFDEYNEYQIGVRAVDDVGRRYITFQFRPALPEASTVEGDRIKSMPGDLPEGIRVQIHSANVHPDEVVDVLHGLTEAMTIDTRYFRPDNLHEWSSCYNLALYVRMRRDISEDRIVSRSGLLERLAMLSSQRRGRGEYRWDNEEIVGHRNAVALDAPSCRKLLPDQTVGKLLKSYHMKHPTRDASDDPTTQPKLEVQYSTKYSEPDLESVPWFATSEYDLQDLLHELDEYLVNGLHWAGLPVRADEGVFVADDYWDVDESERDLRVVEDPTEKIQVIEGDLATHHLLRSDLTRAERLAFRTLADGGPIHYLEAADQSETSKSTVYRMASKLSDIVRKSHGELRLEDDIVAEKVSNLFATIDDVVDWVEDGIDQLVNDMDGILASDSPLARWARVYGAQISDERGRMEVELRAGSYNEYEIRRILRNGFDASRAVGANAAERFTDAVFVWRDQAGNRITSESAIAVQRDATVRFLGAPMRTLR